MPSVQYSLESLKKCICPGCPVQTASECIRQSARSSVPAILAGEMPPPASAAALYCAAIVGRSDCGDFKIDEQCQCPSCEVWVEGCLGARYFCAKGSSEMLA
jgi:hypothetical protein